ncbi:MAG TPA: hypothetical protein P5274_00700 [Candidatus Paceibacterota bacterium]|nr:hypothetical protein [Candidatus Paceibacterota bacterium]
MAVVASTKKKETTDSVVLKFWEEHPGASPPEKIGEKKLRFLIGNKGLRTKTIKVKNDQGITILLAVTKATENNPSGKIVFVIPRRA